MRNTGLEEAQAGINIAGRNIINLRYADDTTLMTESEEELKSLLMKVKKESEKVGSKLNIQKTKIMESGPMTSWHIDGETVQVATAFILGGSKITEDGDCSHEINFLGRKVMTKLDSILKSRHYFASKGPSSQGYGFSSSPVWMWELDYKESWVLKDWCCGIGEDSWEFFGHQPVHPKGNQSWIFIGRTDAEAETPIFGYLLQRTDSLEKTLMLGKIEGGRRRGW